MTENFVCVLGSNGAGKSTLLNAISGALQADTGTIVLDGIDLSGRPEHVRSRYMGRLFPGSDARDRTGHEHR